MSRRDQSGDFRRAMQAEIGCAVGEAMARGLTRNQAFDELSAREDRSMAVWGYYIHYVTSDPEVGPGLANIHTHGIGETWGHPEFQVVVPIPPDVATAILDVLADRVKAGERFEAGRRYGDVIARLDVMMVEATEGGRPVLRVILPDPAGCLDREEIEPPWDRQWPGGGDGAI